MNHVINYTVAILHELILSSLAQSKVNGSFLKTSIAASVYTLVQTLFEHFMSQATLELPILSLWSFRITCGCHQPLFAVKNH